VIILEDVHYTYDGIYTALQGISLQVDDGERLAVIGANGAGKTTMIKHMNGLLRPQEGRVILDGQDTKFMSVAEIAREVGLVFQNPDHQLFLDSVKKEVEFGLRNIGFTENEAEQRRQKTLASLGLEDLAERSPFTLSGGERKRVALASVLSTEPRFLALDEPTIGQDAHQKNRLAQMLAEMNKRGRTVVVVTHDIEFVIENFPRTVAMAEGQIIADGSTNMVLSNDEVIERCSLAPPQMTLAARAIRNVFPEVGQRLTLLSELEETIMGILGGA
jgi:energy-coupling factor transport system ATP-binding protein